MIINTHTSNYQADLGEGKNLCTNCYEENTLYIVPHIKEDTNCTFFKTAQVCKKCIQDWEKTNRCPRCDGLMSQQIQVITQPLLDNTQIPRTQCERLLPYILTSVLASAFVVIIILAAVGQIG